MIKPKMILFDYGDTLLSEPVKDYRRGYRELLKYATANPNNCGVDELEQAVERFFNAPTIISRELYFDVGAQRCYRSMFEFLQMEFSLTPDEIEQTFWTAAVTGALMPGVDRLLDYLDEHGVRYGVVSNTCWSSATLTERITRFLPRARFEFIMASSEYLYRKPDKMIFEIALKKARLEPEDVWFCGDRLDWDVKGAADAGVFPVWYDSDAAVRSEENAVAREQGAPVECLHMRDWNELIEKLEAL